MGPRAPVPERRTSSPTIRKRSAAGGGLSRDPCAVLRRNVVELQFMGHGSIEKNAKQWLNEGIGRSPGPRVIRREATGGRLCFAGVTATRLSIPLPSPSQGLTRQRVRRALLRPRGAVGGRGGYERGPFTGPQGGRGGHPFPFHRPARPPFPPREADPSPTPMGGGWAKQTEECDAARAKAIGRGGCGQ